MITSSLGDFRRSERPLISAVVATYNEERHIESCLRSLLRQRHLPGGLEIVVIDGCSTDKTVEVIQRLPEFGSRIRLLTNPKRLQVFAWNAGLKEARGEYFVTISAHTDYSEDYLAECLAALTRTQAAAVGAVQTPVGSGALGQVIAWAMRTPFGVGNARFRYAAREEEVESAFAAFYKTSTLTEINGYDESNPFDEDSDLHYRIRQRGGRIIVCPSIQVSYHVRSSLPTLARQMFRYGYWRRRTQITHPQKTPLRTYVPAGLVLGLIFSAALLPFHFFASAIIPFSYLLFLLTASVSSWRAVNVWFAPLLVWVVLPTMHVSYGCGWLLGFLNHRRPEARAYAEIASQ